MKKSVLAFMMAAAMVFGSSTAVMAAGEGQSSAADTMTVTIKKKLSGKRCRWCEKSGRDIPVCGCDSGICCRYKVQQYRCG